jgi:hypothetical protein
MERTLDTVLRSIHIPDIASGMVSRSPSPSTQTAATQALMASPSPPPPTPPPGQQPPVSPKLHSLPDNTLNPLGLLAEASLANRRAQLGAQRFSGSITATASNIGKLGVASDNYFKPGMFSYSFVRSHDLNLLGRSNDNLAPPSHIHRTAGPARDAEFCQYG